MSITLNGVALPSGLVWHDLGYTRIKQKIHESVTGHIVIQRGAMQEGRPITLTGSNKAWLTRTELEAISVLRTELDALTLNYHGTEYQVKFKLGDADHFKYEGVFADIRSDEPDTKCILKQLKLFEVIA